MPKTVQASLRRLLAILPALFVASALAAPVTLDLPAQPLAQALGEWARVSGMSVAVDGSLVAGRNAPALSGTMEPAEALRRLLANSGLTATFSGTTAVIARADGPTTLREVSVSAAPLNSDGSTPESAGLVVPNQTFGPLGTLPASQIPFSTTSIPRAVIDDQQARTLYDMVRNDASVTTLYTATGPNAEAVNIRGWALDFSMGYRMDGGAVSFEGPVAPELLERVDIYKGLDGFLYGFVTPGGMINYVTKQPLDEPLTRYTQSFAGRSALGEAIDVSRRFGADRQFGVRLNVATENGDEALANQHIERSVLGVAVDWKPVQGARLWASYAYAHSNLTGVQPGFFLNTFPTSGPTVYVPNPDVSTNYGQSWFFNARTAQNASVGAEWDVAGWHLRASTSQAMSRESKQNIFGAALDADGSYTGTALLTTPDAPDDFRGYDLLISRAWTIASMEHKLSLAATSTTQTGSYLFGNTSQGDITGSLDHPTYVPDPAVPPTTTRHPFDRRIDFDNVLLVDTVKVDDYLRVIAGVARPHVNEKLVFFGSSGYSGIKTAPQAAVIVTPVEGISVYASYVESYQAGGFVNDPGADNNGSLLPPYVSKQDEIGFKAALTEGLQFNGAAFRMTMPSQFNQPTTSGHYVVTQSGEQVNKGLELSLAGKVGERLAVMGSLMYLEPRQYLGAPTPGSVIAGLPRSTARVYAQYQVPGLTGLSLDGGLAYTGRVLGIAPSVYFSDHVLADAGAKLTTRVADFPVTARLYVHNLFDRNYWADGSSSVGEPRTVRASVQVDF
ncbi:MAG: TonB-dependent receptor [Proteobacteria bacterium]|nr:TonB-dependent receptor [Pseudomonadota bacterium]